MMKKIWVLLTTFMMILFASSAWCVELTVKSSVESTLQFHRQLKSVQENRQAAVHDVRRAQAGWLPKVDASAGTGVSSASNVSTRAMGTDQYLYGASNAGITLSQPLWDGLGTKYRVEAANLTLSSLSYRVLDNATTLALDAILAHTDVLLRRQLVKIAYENVKQHQIIMDAQQERMSSGTITMADITQVQGRLARVRSALAEAQGNLRQSEEKYLRFTGVMAAPQMEAVYMPSPMFDGPESCFAEAQKYNPKLLAYFEDSKQARALQSVTTAAYQPNLNVEARTNVQDGGPTNTWGNSVDIMLVMRWNLYNGGGDLAAERVAAAQFRQAREEAFNLNDTLKEQVFNFWTQYSTAKDLENHYMQAIAFNTKTRDGFMEQFLVGQRSLLDVLDASSEYFNSSTQYSIAMANRHIAAFTMQALAGGLLSQFNIDKKWLLQTPN